jgi:galactokinase/mevalonate kinase-like predicted kinase
VHDEDILSWLEDRLYLVTLGPRTSEYDVLSDTKIDTSGARALAEAAEGCWAAILAKDANSFGRHVRLSFEAQIAMFPNMVDDGIMSMIEQYREVALGWKLSGAGGGGYLIMVSETPIEPAVRVKIRRKEV